MQSIQNNLRVPVLDSSLTPLMPTSPVRARLLLATGRAKAYWNKLGIFCIILNKEVRPHNQKIVLGIDPGSKYEGFSVVGQKFTVLNGMSSATSWVKDSVEQRRTMRRGRRYRKCPQRKIRFNNRSSTLPPSTKARWSAKLRIVQQLCKVLPLTDIVVEDVVAFVKRGNKRWNDAFCPLVRGKQWFYTELAKFGLTVILKKGFDTEALRKMYNLKKSKQKGAKTFFSHAVDAWVLAASVSGAVNPTWYGIYHLTPIRLHRRQLHMFQPSCGAIRRSYGGTRSMGLTRGTLVMHDKYGIAYVGGTLNGKLSLHSLLNGERITQYALLCDLKILTVIRWRSVIYS